MISSNQSKLIRSLSQKKFRDQSRLYLVEGEKMIGEILGGKGGKDHKVMQVYATSEWIDRNNDLLDLKVENVNEVTAAELKKVSNLVAPQQVLALVSKPDENPKWETLLHHPVLAFESIRDPGNLGTIIRTADWFGINHIVCTPDSVDVFNPKVVQATMGAIVRVKLFYIDFAHLFSKSGMNEKIVYGTFLNGENIYKHSLDRHPLILFGNESHGLSDHYDYRINRRISIPSYSRRGKGSESLNVAASVAVFCSELKRMG